MQTLNPISLLTAIKGVLAGIPTGLITPNRLGNFIGRTQLLQKEIRTKASLLTILANLAQFVPSVFFGCLSLLITTTNFHSTPHLMLFIGGSLLVGLGMLLYFNPKLIIRKRKKALFSEQIIQSIYFIQETTWRLKVWLLILSAIRYFVFVSQFVLLLLLFNQNYPIFLLYLNVSLVYLLMTIVPGLLFGKLFLREAAALLVLGMLGIPDLVILWTGFILWIVNIGLPSLIGTLILLRNK